MRNEKDQKNKNASQTFLNKMAELITSGEPGLEEQQQSHSNQSRLDHYKESVDQQVKSSKNERLEKAIGQIHSAFSHPQGSEATHKAGANQSPTETHLRHLSKEAFSQSELTSLISDTPSAHQQYNDLVSRLIQKASEELSAKNLSVEIDKWQDLYENFRIGLQLGFRYFSKAIMESGEDIPDQEEPGSPWNWNTWETMVGNLLNNFDQYCAKEIGIVLDNPGYLFEEAELLHAISIAKDNQSLDIDLWDNLFQLMAPEIIRRVDRLSAKLEMNEKLADTIHNPGTIANDFETYLWANYIDKQNIGSYGHSLRERLFGLQRRAPSGEVTRRLQFLKVAEAEELDKIIGQRSANGQLKKLNDWAREHVCEFNTWEKICYDSTRFLPRSLNT